MGDQSRSQLDGLVRSLITQLVSQAGILPPSLRTLYAIQSGNGKRQPPTAALVHVLRDLITRLDDCFILIDALDECQNRWDVIDFLLDLLNDDVRSLHLLVASRREPEIQDVLSVSCTLRFDLDNWFVDNDIQLFIRSRLRNSRRLGQWPEHTKAQIRETVGSRSNGR